MLADVSAMRTACTLGRGLNAPTGAWCLLTHLASVSFNTPVSSLNAPTGAWCLLTGFTLARRYTATLVLMHLQVRGAC